MNSPLVAVFMVTYNHENFIGQAIESVLMQKTTFPIKLFIGEDSSTDLTAAICSKYQEENPQTIEAIFNKENIGASNNALRIFKNCVESGAKYIAMLEGDDYWTDPLKLQKQVDFLEENTNFALIHTNKSVLRNGVLYTDESLKIKSGFIFEDLLFSPSICTLTVLGRADVLMCSLTRVRSLIENRKWLMGDFPLWLDIARNHQIAYMNDVTGVYRFLDDSTSHSNIREKSYQFEQSVISVKEHFFQEYRKSNKSITLRFRLHFYEQIFHANKRLVLDNGWKAKREIKSLVFTNPLLTIYIFFRKISRVLRNS